MSASHLNVRRGRLSTCGTPVFADAESPPGLTRRPRPGPFSPTSRSAALAHRLATISRFPRVAMIQDGAIIAAGSAAELLTNCPPFAELFAEQLFRFA